RGRLQPRRRRVHRRHVPGPPPGNCRRPGRRRHARQAIRRRRHPGRRAAPLPARPRRPRRNLRPWLLVRRHPRPGREHPAPAPRAQAVSPPSRRRASRLDPGAVAQKLL
ncbi:hypothetical protein H4R26_005959, partial [Coemansia thaxteri]